MALLLAEEIHHRGLADKIIYGSERSSVAMRKKISELCGGVELFDIPGLTELYGPDPCTCGSLLPRHSRLRSRTDDMFKFRGVNIYPSGIDRLISEIPGLGSEYQVHLSRDSHGRGHLLLESGTGRRC